MSIRRIFGSDSESYKNPLKKLDFPRIADSLEFKWIADFRISIADDFSNIFKGLFITKNYMLLLNLTLFRIFIIAFFF